MNRDSFMELFLEAEKEFTEMPGSYSPYFEAKLVKYFLPFGDRCALFKIFSEENKLMCQIVQGEPPDRHKIGPAEPLIYHPDIAEAATKKEIFFIREPRTCQATKYFLDLIRQYGINQILYVPVLLAGKQTGWVLAIDACGQKIFTLADLHFCLLLEELFSFYLWREINPSGKWSNFVFSRTINHITPLLPHEEILRPAL